MLSSHLSLGSDLTQYGFTCTLAVTGPFFQHPLKKDESAGEAIFFGVFMEWFRHDSNANLDDKLQQVLLNYGLEGYGLYWYCIELIVNKVSKDNITFELKHDARVIARNTGSTPQKVEEMMKHFVDIGLFENTQGIITCMKVAKRLSASATSNQTMRALIHQINENKELPSPSCHRHDVVMKEEKRIEKKRVNKTNLPENFAISERVIKWANQNGYRDLQKHFDNFVLSAQSGGYKYSDWDSAFMKAIRDNWAKVPSNKLELVM